jgi:hypothetical protein
MRITSDPIVHYAYHIRSHRPLCVSHPIPSHPVIVFHLTPSHLHSVESKQHLTNIRIHHLSSPPLPSPRLLFFSHICICVSSVYPSEGEAHSGICALSLSLSLSLSLTDMYTIPLHHHTTPHFTALFNTFLCTKLRYSTPLHSTPLA